MRPHRHTSENTIQEPKKDAGVPHKAALLDNRRKSSEDDDKNLSESTEESDDVNKFTCGASLGGLLQAAFDIALERRELLGAIKSALEHQDHPEVIRLVTKLCGATDEKSSGAHSGINGESSSRDKR